MIHCIRFDKEIQMTGFKKKMTFDDEIEYSIIEGSGLEEGFTAMCTKIRNTKFNKNEERVESYPILAELTQILNNIIGEDQFLDIGFNNPQDFYSIIDERYNLESIFSDFLENMDLIKKAEEKIVLKKYAMKNSEVVALKNIFGKNFMNFIVNKDIEKKVNGSRISDDTIKMCSIAIANFYSNIIRSQSDNSIDRLGKICEVYESITKLVDINIIDNEIIDDFEKLYKGGMGEEEILAGLDISYDYKSFLNREFYIRKISGFSAEEKLKLLSNPETEEKIEDYGFFDIENFKQEERLNSAIFNSNSNDANRVYNSLLRRGLAETILKNGWNFDKIGLEYIDLQNDRYLFNLFQEENNEKKYLGTFAFNDDKFEEFSKVVSEKRKNEIIKNNPEFEGMTILENQNGGVVAYNNDNEYIDDSEGEGKSVYYKSKETIFIQNMFESLKSRLNNIKRYIEFDVNPLININIKEAKEIITELRAHGIVLDGIEEMLNFYDEGNFEKLSEKVSAIQLTAETIGLQKDFKKVEAVENMLQANLKDCSEIPETEDASVPNME